MTRPTMPDFNAIQKEAAGAINTDWRYSQHWDKTEFGTLTLKGWKQAHKDGCDRMCQLLQDREQIAKSLEKVRKAIEYLEWLEED